MGKPKNYIKKLLRILFGINNLYEHIFFKFARKNPIIVDLGAGEGNFIALMLGKNRCSEAILVEADPFLTQKLTKRFAEEINIKILNAAVGGKSNDRVKFYLTKNTEFNSLFRSLNKLGGEREGQNEVNVRMITLEDIFLLFDLKEIDLLKIDIEGAEWDIFEKFTKHDFERVHQISVEFHDFLDSSQRWRTEKCIKRLQGFGYEFISKGTSYMQGTPYFNCLFYDRKQLKYTTILRWLKIQSLPFRSYGFIQRFIC